MQVKKYPNAILENYSKVLIELGLVLALFIVYEFIKIKSYPREAKELVSSYVSVDDSKNLIEIKEIIPETPQPKAQAVMPDKIVKVEDEIDVQETIIESTESDEAAAVTVSIENEIENVEEEEEVVEDVAFVVIEDVPVYPGCTGNRDQLRACFSSQITKFVSQHFNADLASDIGLEPGSIQRIFVMFKIDRDGSITDIQARAPHKRLQDEAVRVVKMLPTMTPGKQRGKPVGVKYGLPIVFKVE